MLISKMLLAGALTAVMLWGLSAALPQDIRQKLGTETQANAITSGKYEYKILDDGTAAITNYTGTGVIIKIPATIDGYNVTQICSAFCFNEDIISVIIPEGVTFIDNYAFNGCSKLASVKIPSTVTEIEGGAFEDTLWLANKRAADPLVTVNNILIDGQTAAGAVEIPDTVKSISREAFSDNTEITSVKLPSGLTELPHLCFANCTNLSEVTFPSTLKTFGYDVFKDTAWLANKQAADPLVIVNNVVLDGRAAKGAVTVPSTVTGFVQGSFYFSEITSVNIPNKVTELPYQCFFECRNLKTVKFGSGLKFIDKQAFDGCEALKSAALPNGLETIGSAAFMNCSCLESVNLPDTVKQIGSWAFSFCYKLDSVAVPASVEEIGDKAFGYVYNDPETWDSLIVKSPFTMYVFKGTAGEKYAIDNNITYFDSECDLGKAKVTIPYSSYTYRGRGIKPTVTVKDSTGKTLTKGTDYTVSYKNNTNVGTATITVTGKGKYFGKATKTFTVKKLDLASSYAKISIPYSAYTYTGSAVKPAVTVKFKDGDLIPESDYTVSYSNNKAVGVATITVKGKGTNVTGTYKKEFVVKPAKNEITSISTTSGAFKISWKKGTAGTVGYQVQYSTDKNFEKNVHSWTTTTLTKLSENFSSVPRSGETWYVKVRSFYTKDGKATSTRYGNYSAVKSIKVK